MYLGQVLGVSLKVHYLFLLWLFVSATLGDWVYTVVEAKGEAKGTELFASWGRACEAKGTELFASWGRACRNPPSLRVILRPRDIIALRHIIFQEAS